MFYLLGLSVILFSAGFYGVLTCRNLRQLLPPLMLIYASAAFVCVVFNARVRAEDSGGFFLGAAFLVVGIVIFKLGTAMSVVDSYSDSEGEPHTPPTAELRSDNSSQPPITTAAEQ